MPSSIINWLNNHWHTTISHIISHTHKVCCARPLDLAPVFWCVLLPRNCVRRKLQLAFQTGTETQEQKRERIILRDFSSRSNQQDWRTNGYCTFLTAVTHINAAAQWGEQREKCLTLSLIIIPKWSVCEGVHLSMINCRVSLIKQRITCLTFCRNLALTSSQSSGTQSS